MAEGQTDCLPNDLKIYQNQQSSVYFRDLIVSGLSASVKFQDKANNFKRKKKKKEK